MIIWHGEGMKEWHRMLRCKIRNKMRSIIQYYLHNLKMSTMKRTINGYLKETNKQGPGVIHPWIQIQPGIKNIPENSRSFQNAKLEFTIYWEPLHLH